MCMYVHFAWKGRPRNDLYCVGWDVKTLLTRAFIQLLQCAVGRHWVLGWVSLLRSSAFHILCPE